MTTWAVSSDWEYNGRDDSDWYVVVYDDESDTLHQVMIGTTRFAGCSAHGRQICYECQGVSRNPSDEVMARAQSALLRSHETAIRSQAEWRIQHPGHCEGCRVRTTAEVSNRPRTVESEPCAKCGGTGHWTNPRNQADQRECFACHGSGSHTTSRAAKGKAVKIPVGTEGTVRAVYERRSQYGTWNDVGPAIVIRDDGTEFRAPLDSIELVATVDEEAVRREAAALAARGFYPAFASSRAGVEGFLAAVTTAAFDSLTKAA